MENNVFFSIILPTFNRADKIRCAIDSVINQTFKNWELIIIDNNSQDDTEKIVLGYENKKILFCKIDNEGVIAKSRNYGIKKSRGIYICFLDSDDWWDVKKLELVYEKAKLGHSFIYHNHFIYAPNRLIKKRKIYSKKIQKPFFYNLIKFGPSFATSSIAVNKSEFKKVNFFDTDKKYVAWEDFDAWLRLSKIVNSFCRINKTLSTIYLDNTNFLNDDLKLKNMNLFLRKYLSEEDKIPTWCLYNTIVAEYNLRNYKKVKLDIKKIKFFKINFFQKLNLIRILINVFFR